jgi:hypothetical protein
MSDASLAPESPMHRLLLIVLLSLVAACNSTEDFTPTEPSPGSTIPTIGGTYSSPTMWRFELVGASAQEVFSCAGSVTIGTQIADSFSGTFLIRDDACGGAFAGTMVNGIFRTDNTVGFELLFADGTLNFLASGVGCTYVSGDRILAGTLVGTRLEAQARTELDCPAPLGRATQTVRIDGNR